MSSEMKLIERQCKAENCTKTFRVWPETSKAMYCCQIHKAEPELKELKRFFIPARKAEYVPHFGQYGETK